MNARQRRKAARRTAGYWHERTRAAVLTHDEHVLRSLPVTHAAHRLGEELALDRLIYGYSVTRDGQRVPPALLTVLE